MSISYILSLVNSLGHYDLQGGGHYEYRPTLKDNPSLTIVNNSFC
ncbi:MAG: hypothetical protein PVG45_09450 [Gammaproteobacteria bacterium]